MQRAHPGDLFDDVDDRDGAPGPGQLVPPPPTHVMHRPPGVVAHRERVVIAAGQAARRVPYAATAATAGLGYSAWGLVEAAAGTSAGGAIALGTCAATAAALPVLRFRHRDRVTAEGRRIVRVPHEFRRRWWAAGGVAALWVDAMALGASSVIGADGMAAILLTGAAALSARWMRRHPVLELPTDTPPPVLAAAPPVLELPEPPRFPTRPPPDEGDLLKREWDVMVAGNVVNDEGLREENLIAPGAGLGDDREDHPHAYSWFIQLPRTGNVSISDLKDQRGAIALKLGWRKSHVLIEPLRGDHEREDRGRLTIVVRDVLKDGVDYPGPRYLADGRIPLGKFADGSTIPPYWICKDNKGPRGGMIVGATGSGKSETLARLGMAMRTSGEWIVLFGDGDERGRSAPLLKRIAFDFAAGHEQVMAQLEALEAWFNARGDDMGEYTTDADGLPVPMTEPGRQEPAEKLMPCPQMPGWVWILDEFKALTQTCGPDFVPRVGRLKREMRKRGGTIIIGTQSGQVGDFGGDEALLSQVKGENVVLLRTASDLEQYSMPGDFGCDPTTLPDKGGYGFINDPDNSKQMFRGEYDKDMALWVRSLPEYRPDEHAAEVYGYKRPPVPSDPVADYEESRRRKEATRQAMREGKPLPWEPQPEPEQPTGPVGADGAAPAGSTAPQDEWMGGVAQPILVGVDDAPARPAREWGPLTQPEQLVLGELVAVDGPARNQAIVAATGLSEPAVSKALARTDVRSDRLGLVPRGYAVRRGQGLHEATAAGRVVANELALAVAEDAS
jgi:hypothetical protein